MEGYELLFRIIFLFTDHAHHVICQRGRKNKVNKVPLQQQQQQKIETYVIFFQANF